MVIGPHPLPGLLKLANILTRNGTICHIWNSSASEIYIVLLICKEESAMMKVKALIIAMLTPQIR